jgi:hypothetical protein
MVADVTEVTGLRAALEGMLAKQRLANFGSERAGEYTESLRRCG